MAAIVSVNRNPDDGITYDLDVYEFRGIPYRDGMDESIRFAHQAWLAAGAAVEYERNRLESAVCRLADQIKNGGIFDD